MTRFRSKSVARKSVIAVFRPAARLIKSFGVLFLAGCASSSGVPTGNISQPEIAAAYIPLHSGGVLSHAEGAAVVIAPGIAVTNGHNRNLVAPETVIGQSRDYDLLFFRDARTAPVTTAEPQVGGAIEAYGQGMDGDLRTAHGVVRSIETCSGCVAPAYFVFAGNAGPGFSGGPVLDPSGRLIGITFGYKNQGRERLIYAYPMSRIQAELSALSGARK
ncbi:MAG: trypsin-like peptidase domain-containing protein [Rhizomicrobium sp.]